MTETEPLEFYLSLVERQVERVGKGGVLFVEGFTDALIELVERAAEDEERGEEALKKVAETLKESGAWTRS